MWKSKFESFNKISNFRIDFAKTSKMRQVRVCVFELRNQIKFHFNFGLKTLLYRPVTNQWLNSTASIMHYTYTIVIYVCVLITFFLPLGFQKFNGNLYSVPTLVNNNTVNVFFWALCCRSGTVDSLSALNIEE